MRMVSAELPIIRDEHCAAQCLFIFLLSAQFEINAFPLDTLTHDGNSFEFSLYNNYLLYILYNM